MVRRELQVFLMFKGGPDFQETTYQQQRHHTCIAYPRQCRHIFGRNPLDDEKKEGDTGSQLTTAFSIL